MKGTPVTAWGGRPAERRRSGGAQTSMWREAQAPGNWSPIHSGHKHSSRVGAVLAPALSRPAGSQTDPPRHRMSSEYKTSLRKPRIRSPGSDRFKHPSSLITAARSLCKDARSVSPLKWVFLNLSLVKPLPHSQCSHPHPLILGDTVHDPQCSPETTGSTATSIHAFFQYTHASDTV